MSIGNKIYELRTAKNLSQGELADILNVSRQSVSKWETDMAVPDLDKLIKLCDLFNISLDELAGRGKSESRRQEYPEKKPVSSTQKIIGYILFIFSLLLGLLVLLFGKNEGDFIIMLPISFALLACGLLCLFAGNKAFYWCIWTALAPLAVLTPFFVGFSVLSIFTTIIIITFIIMIFVARAAFKDVVVKTSKKKSVLLILGWSLPFVLYGLLYCLSVIAFPPSYSYYNGAFSIILNFACYCLIALLETYTVCYIRSLKNK